MEKNFNLSSLSTVYTPIEEYITQVKNGLQENLVKVKDNGKIATEFGYIEILNKMRNVFEMVGLQGLTKVLLLVEEANKGLQEANFSTKTSITLLEESLNIIKSVEAYIKQLLDGSLDQPTRFFDKYKKLADTVDVEVNIKDLFTPKLEVKDLALRNELKAGHFLVKNNEEEIRDKVESSVEKISEYIPIILDKVSKFRDLENAEEKIEFKYACKVVYDALADLQTLKLSKQYYVLIGIQKLLVCVCAPFFNEDFNTLAINNLQSMKENLGLIEETALNFNDGIKELKLGKKTSTVKLDDNVVKENLFFVILAISQNPMLKDMPVFKELEAYFDYDFYEEQLSSDTIKATVMYQNNGLTEQLEKILFEMKEELVIVTGKKHNEDAYNQHVSKFYVLNYKFWETLKIASGENNFKSFASAMVELTEKMKAKKIDISEEVKKEISISVVWFEYAINNLIKKRIEQKVRIEFEKQMDIQEQRVRKLTNGESIFDMPVPILDAKSKEQEARKAILKIYEEVEKDLKVSEETLDSILRMKSLEDKDLDLVLKPLNSIKGILLVLGNKDMGELVKELIRIWKCVQQNGLDSIPETDLKKSVILFAGLSLFVSASRENNVDKAREIEAKLMLEYKGAPAKTNVKSASFEIQDSVNNIKGAEDISLDIKTENAPGISFDLESDLDISNDVNELINNNLHDSKTIMDNVKLVEEVKLPVSVHNNELETSEAEDPELLEIFVEEVIALVEECQNSINILRKNPHDKDEAITLRRIFHTYKGSGRMIGIQNLGEVAWTVEQELNKIVAKDQIELKDYELNALEIMNNKCLLWSKDLMANGKLTLAIQKEQAEFLNQFAGHISMEMESQETDDTLRSTIDSSIDSTIENISISNSNEIENNIQSSEIINMSEGQIDELREVEKSEHVDLATESTLDEFIQVPEIEELENSDNGNNLVISNTETESVEEILNEEDILVPEIETDVSEVDVPQIEELENLDEFEVPVIEEIETFSKKEEDDVIQINERHEENINIIDIDNINTDASNSEKIIELEPNESDQDLSLSNEEVNAQTENLEENVKVTHDEFVDEPMTDDIYALCQIEIQEYLNKLENITDAEELTQPECYEVMRLGHTISSLSKTSNLMAFGEITNKIEVIGEVMLEKNKSLSTNNLKELNQIIIDLREKSNKDNLPDEEFVQEYIIRLLRVKQSLVETDTGNSEGGIDIDINEISENVENSVKQGLTDLLNNHINGVNKTLTSQLESFQNRQVKELAEDREFLKDFSQVPKQLESLAQQVEKNSTDIEDLKKAIETINTSVEDIKESTAHIKKEAIGRLKKLKEEVVMMKEPVKKKSNGYDFFAFQEEITLISMIINVEEDGVDNEVKHCLSLLLEIDMTSNEATEVLELLDKLEENINNTLELCEMNSDEISIQTPNILNHADLEENYSNDMINTTPIELSELGQDMSENKEISLDNDLEAQQELKSILASKLVQDIFEEQISIITDEYEEQMYEIARDEIEEKKQQIEDILELTNTNKIDIDLNAEIKRHLHTLKGSLRMAGLNKMGTVAHRLESLLDYTENHQFSLYVVKPILVDELNKLKFLENNKGEIPKDKIKWVDNLNIVVDIMTDNQQNILINENNTRNVEKILNEARNVFHTKQDEKQNIKVSSKVLDDLFNDAGEIRLTRITLEGSIVNHQKYLTDMKSASKKMSSLLRELEIQAETQISAKKELAEEQGEAFDPLEFDRYTRLQELTRFMNEALADIEDGIVDIESVQKLQENTVVQQNIVSNNILSSIMNVRLTPVDSINERLYRISRNTSKDLGKQMILEISGEKTEIDRFVLDKVFDPLAHILRNCIAHGIESPEKRESLGKNKVGKVNLDIKQEGNFITITVTDDGEGINIKKVKEKAIEKGLIKKGKNISEEDIIDLIYHSGFSTADVVSQVSGRGVGMDVVKKEILSLGGTVKTSSVTGKGSSFKIVLPVSVATNQVLISTTMGKLVAIPAILVEEVLSVKASELEEAYKKQTIDVKGSILPLNYMGQLTGTIGNNQTPKINPYNILVVVAHGDEKAVIHLDKLETTEEILIKPVGPYFGKIQGLLGATLLGDGRQGLVVNPVLLREHYYTMMKSVKNDTKEITKILKVMVVDDANTVRRTTEKILKKYGYEVQLAVDGSNALELLSESIPDIILSDIEMPVMNGFEFLKSLKASESYKNIPVIMITSRTADKHKEMAFELGCDGFLGKPYLENDLIENIKLLTKIKK